MLRTLFQNEPNEYKESFKQEVKTANFRMVNHGNMVLFPVSMFMLIMSILIKDDKSIILANSALAGVSILLLIGNRVFDRLKLENNFLTSIFVHLMYAAILFWGMHMIGNNPEGFIFVMDMVLSVYILAFLFITRYQVIGAYFGLSIFYLYVFTPYLKEGLGDLPKMMTPILLVISAFFLSRMNYTQFIDRFILSEKLKESQIGLKSELYNTLETLRLTERGVSNDMLRTLVKVLEYHDLYTRGHSENVSEFAVKIAKELGLKEDQIDEILVCGLVHDIGKILIPADLLNKVQKLTDQEYKVIQNHSQYGYDLLMEAKHLKRIAKIVLHHHERWDGRGYPLGLKGNEIPLESQILIVADAWDAMTSERVYKKAKTVDEARKEMISQKGKQFDPDMVDVLLKIVSE